MNQRATIAMTALLAIATGGCEVGGMVTVDWKFTTTAGSVEPCPSEVARFSVTIRTAGGRTGFFEERFVDCAAGTTGPVGLVLGEYESVTTAFRENGDYASTSTPFSLFENPDDPRSSQTEVQISEDFIVDGGRVVVEASFVGGFLPGPIRCPGELPTLQVTLEHELGAVTRHDFPCQPTSTVRAIQGRYTAEISLLDSDGARVHVSPRKSLEITAPNGAVVIAHEFEGL